MKRLLVPLTTLLLLLGGVAPTVTAPASAAGGSGAGETTAARAAACTDVLFLGARGSGQRERDAQGYGAQVDAVRQALADELAALPVPRSMTAIALRRRGYPAHHVKRILDPRVGPDGYRRGVETAASYAVGLLREHAARCPEQRVVLAGYSQGAMVVHQAANRLTGLSELRRVDGVVLLADGYRARGTRTHLVGAPVAPRRRGGIGIAFPPSPRPRDVQAALRPVAWSVCQRGDLVCDYAAGSLARGVGVHLGAAYKSGRLVTGTAARVAATVRRTPKAGPASLVVQGVVGQPLSHRLVADVASAAAVEWRVAPGATLPEGLTLAPDGLLGGASPVPVDSRVAVQLRAAGGPWQSDTLALVVSDDAGALPDEPVPAAYTIEATTDVGAAFTATPTAKGAWLLHWDTGHGYAFRWVHADGTRGVEVSAADADLTQVGAVASLADGSVAVIGYDTDPASPTDGHQFLRRFGPTGMLTGRDFGSVPWGGQVDSLAQGADGHLYLRTGSTLQRLAPRSLATLSTIAGGGSWLSPTPEALVTHDSSGGAYRIPYAAFDAPEAFDVGATYRLPSISERQYALTSVALDGTVLHAAFAPRACAAVELGYLHADGTGATFDLGLLGGTSQTCEVEDAEALPGGRAVVQVATDVGRTLVFFDRAGDAAQVHDYGDAAAYLAVQVDGAGTVVAARARWRACDDEGLPTAYCPTTYIDRFTPDGVREELGALGASGEMVTPQTRSLVGASALAPGNGVLGLAAYRYSGPSACACDHGSISGQSRSTFEVVPLGPSRLSAKSLAWW